MSYCRFTEGDVYAYVCDGGVQFYVSDGRRELDRLCNTFSDAYQYARALRDIYELDVPSYAIEALKADALEEATRICGVDSAVAELQAENANLRDLCSELLENLMPELCGKAYWPCLNRDWHKCNDGTCGNRDFVLRAQSLGVEIDGD